MWGLESRDDFFVVAVGLVLASRYVVGGSASMLLAFTCHPAKFGDSIPREENQSMHVPKA